eukprot:463225-Amphidinium_carterae.1
MAKAAAPTCGKGTLLLPAADDRDALNSKGSPLHLSYQSWSMNSFRLQKKGDKDAVKRFEAVQPEACMSSTVEGCLGHVTKGWSWATGRQCNLFAAELHRPPRYAYAPPTTLDETVQVITLEIQLHHACSSVDVLRQAINDTKQQEETLSHQNTGLKKDADKLLLGANTGTFEEQQEIPAKVETLQQRVDQNADKIESKEKLVESLGHDLEIEAQWHRPTLPNLLVLSIPLAHTSESADDKVPQGLVDYWYALLTNVTDQKERDKVKLTLPADALLDVGKNLLEFTDDSCTTPAEVFVLAEPIQADTKAIAELLESKEQDSTEEDLHYVPKKIVSVVPVDAVDLPEPRFTEGQLAGRFWTFAPLISLILVLG